MRRDFSPIRLALPIGLATLAVYLALLPWTTQVWLRSGDEPHYLIAAHSLAHDGDFDLRNNYDPEVYQNWYTVADLGKQVRTRADGAEFLVHTYGLPLLIAPVYRLFGPGGVPYFLAALGALLAANVYLLGWQVTGNWKAAAVGWLAVSFAPPLVWYVFLIYPEMAGALCVTLAVRVLHKERNAPGPAGPERLAATPGDHVLLGLALGALPWLSARFIPVMLTLAALALWQVARSGRTEQAASRERWLHWPLVGLGLAALSLSAFSLFNAVLYGDPAPTASYTVPIARPNASGYMLLQLARGLMGWLLDQQRGLLVTAPLYFLALAGLGQWLRGRAWGALVVGATFGAALFSISLLGGFWVGVEPAARYLVHVLPPLGAALAYLWAHRRGPWLAWLAAAGAAVSVLIAAAIFRQPLLAQTESLIGKEAPRLAAVLPALGRNIYLGASPGDIAQAEPDGTLKAPAGSGGIVFRHDAIPDFSFGWYQAQVELAAREAPASEPVARVLIQGGDSSRLLQAILNGADFPADGSLQTFTFPIHNPVYNQWEQPGAMWIFSTGSAELRVGRVAILPAPFQSLILPALWLAGLALAAALLGLQHAPAAAPASPPAWLASRTSLALAAVLAASAAAWSFQPLPRAYMVSDLRHFVGSLEPDGAAASGQALVGRPERADAPGVIASTRAQFYAPGSYVWRLRLKAGAAPAESIVATARIYGARRPVSWESVEIRAAAVPDDGQYHTLELIFDNPLEQALVFELNYLGAARLATDRFQVAAR
jgi:hypothetical protein